ncbi:MAG: 16S rRNA (uracil(1498)-N(3))-methyltransferase [Candidatus Rokubacteria bacterium]|nr:16S rRNA (uracil(1498)-N(3))-methyltransferase [Candidatus Rokubacteria bacterium]
MGKFHVRPEAVSADRVVFDEAETHHLVRVLRLRPGGIVQAVDGRGSEFTVRLEALQGREAVGRIIGRSDRRTESPFAVTLAQGVPKGDKMEWIVKAATELGVLRVVPLLTERVIVRLPPARWRDRQRRWQRVAKEAAKQCGRSVIPSVEPVRTLDEFIAEGPRAGLAVCLWEGEARGLRSLLDAVSGTLASALLVVGPEGGLAVKEVELLRSRGVSTAGLGPRVLRTETAGPVGVALLQARFGDL